MPEEMPAANRMTLQTFKTRLGGAKKGHGLLKKKRDALKARFQGLLKEIIDAKINSGVGLKEASFAFAKAQWANSGSDISSTVIERASKPSCTVALKADNVAGVGLPVFLMSYNASLDASKDTIGVAHGGAVIGACRAEYLKAVKWLVKLASLQTSFKTLDEEIKMTSRRVNALEYVLIPRIVAILAYITSEMDEQTREEFFRVKKVVEKKKSKLEREKLAEKKLEMEKAQAQAGAGRAQQVEQVPVSSRQVEQVPQSSRSTQGDGEAPLSVRAPSKPLQPIVQPAPVAPVRQSSTAGPLVPPAAAEQAASSPRGSVGDEDDSPTLPGAGKKKRNRKKKEGTALDGGKDDDVVF